ncbi:hypothetical protein HAX54_015328 [Datura stramonium]|uniref:RING-CH-type domain-containing protein n=1 Tax=Datura stramonium TaxID=4076 RepID=A0ABS8TRB7_DATST|nr:hypothetical protein [Datura stramonium]
MQDFAAISGNSKTEDLSSNSSKNPEIKEADQVTHEEVKETKCEEKTERGSEIVIDIDDKSENDDEKVCRICHLNDESMEILQLGCDCKAELGVCHRHCAEAWFNQRDREERLRSIQYKFKND